jgi:predicted extracellular nuclease
MRFATFNVQNLRLRNDPGGAHFDGARDEIIPLSKVSAEGREMDRQDRVLTARLIAEAGADVVALQEVFDQRTLDAFHDAHLAPIGARYPHRVCVPGNDGRRHVALMSELEPPAGETASSRVFRRDCLTAICGGVRVFVVHFKAPADEASLAVVRLEALAVRDLIERTFPSGGGDWIVLGDVNLSDVPVGDAIEALTGDDFSRDLALQLPAEERWTYFHERRASYARPDRILASSVLAPRCRDFRIWREGMSRAAEAYSGERLAGVGAVRPRASDHAMLTVDVDV